VNAKMAKRTQLGTPAAERQSHDRQAQWTMKKEEEKKLPRWVLRQDQ